MAINPRNPRTTTGTAPLASRNVRKVRFHVHDLRSSQLGGVPVVEEDGQRVIYLTDSEAEHWKNQFAISDKPFEELSEDHQRIFDAAHGGKLKSMREERRQAEQGKQADQDQTRAESNPHQSSKDPTHSSREREKAKSAVADHKTPQPPQRGGPDQTSR